MSATANVILRIWVLCDIRENYGAIMGQLTQILPGGKSNDTATA